MTQFGAIMVQTLIEMRRRKVFIAPALITVLLLGFAFAPLPPEAPEAWKEVAYAMIAALRHVVVLLAILIGVSLLSQEVETGTVLLLVTKPVRRHTIVLAKGLALLLFLSFFLVVWGVVVGTILAVRVQPDAFDAAVMASFSSIPVVALMLCIALALGAAMSQRLALGCGFAIWFLSFSAPIFLALKEDEFWAERFAAPIRMVELFLDVVPREKLQLMSAHLSLDQPVKQGELLALLAIAGWLGAALLLFWQKRDLNKG